MAAERYFWQVLVVTSRYEAGVHTRVLEYSTKELAEEVIEACKTFRRENPDANETIFAVRLYPEEGK